VSVSQVYQDRGLCILHRHLLSQFIPERNETLSFWL
jgi:hypothetical protein